MTDLAWQFSRMYTGEDGKSHIEQMTLETHPELKELMAGKGVRFHLSQPGTFSDFHPAVQRMFVITLTGEAELGFEDGSIFHIGPGHVNLAEDLTGSGHTSRVVGTVPRLTAVIPLDV